MRLLDALEIVHRRYHVQRVSLLDAQHFEFVQAGGRQVPNARLGEVAVEINAVRFTVSTKITRKVQMLPLNAIFLAHSCHIATLTAHEDFRDRRTRCQR